MSTIQPNRLKLLEAMLRETSQGYGVKKTPVGTFTIPQLRACLSRLDAQIRALKNPVEERLAEGDFEGAYKALGLLEDLVGPDDGSVSGLRWEILDQQVHGPGDIGIVPDIMTKIDFETLHNQVLALYESFGMPSKWDRLCEANKAVDELIIASGWTPEEFDVTCSCRGMSK